MQRKEAERIKGPMRQYQVISHMCNLESQKEKGARENIFEEIIKNFPNLIKKKKINPYIQESQRSPCFDKDI